MNEICLTISVSCMQSFFVQFFRLVPVQSLGHRLVGIEYKVKAMQMLFDSGSYQNISMKIPFLLGEHGEDVEAMPMEYGTWVGSIPWRKCRIPQHSPL